MQHPPLRTRPRRLRSPLIPAVLATVLGACSADLPTPSGGGTPAPASLAEGMALQAEAQVEITTFDAAGRSTRQAFRGPVNATVRQGAARVAGRIGGLDLGGTELTLALAHGRARDLPPRALAPQVGPDGRQVELLVTPGEHGAPPRAMSLRDDGVPVADLQRRWERAGFGWLLREQVLTVYREGRVVAVARIQFGSAVTLAAAPRLPWLAALGHRSAEALLPAPAHAMSGATACTFWGTLALLGQGAAVGFACGSGNLFGCAVGIVGLIDAMDSHVASCK